MRTPTGTAGLRRALWTTDSRCVLTPREEHTSEHGFGEPKGRSILWAVNRGEFRRRSFAVDEVPDDGKGLQFAPREEFEPLADHSVTLETVRGARSKIPGSQDADFLVARNER